MDATYLVERGEFEERLLDRAVVVDVDSVLEHEVHEVRVGLDELVQSLQVLQLLALLFVEDIEVVLVRVQLHVLDRRSQVVFLVDNFPVALLEFLFLVLETSDFLVNLLLHHLVQVLLLYLELLHDPPERLLKTVDLVVELLADFELEFGVQLFASWRFYLVGFNFSEHFLDHALHVHNCGKVSQERTYSSANS